VAETLVVLDRPAKKRRDGKRIVVQGEPLPLRLVVSRVIGADGRKLAEWLLLSNVEANATGADLADWYYWRWQIESYFKLLKSAGMNVESWGQETGEAIAKRLLIGSMAATIVWLLLRTDSEAAKALRLLLIRLSGRQMKWKVESTAPALLAGLQTLLATLDVLEEYNIDDLRRILKQGLPFHPNTS
jgi:hypothetical protein